MPSCLPSTHVLGQPGYPVALVSLTPSLGTLLTGQSVELWACRAAAQGRLRLNDPGNCACHLPCPPCAERARESVARLLPPGTNLTSPTPFPTRTRRLDPDRMPSLLHASALCPPSWPGGRHSFLFLNLFIYLWLCWVFRAAIVVCGLLTAVASLAAGHRLWAAWARYLGCTGFVAPWCVGSS